MMNKLKTFDKDQILLENGYKLIKKTDVALPVTIWKVNIELEYARELKVAEEFTLRLIDAGIKQPTDLYRLMGLDEDVILSKTLIDLITSKKITHQNKLEITNLGRQALSTQKSKQRMNKDVELRHDTYTDKYAWRFDEHEIKDKKSVLEYYSILPAPHGLTIDELQRKHPKIQRLIDDMGLPLALDKLGDPKGPFMLTQLNPISSYQAWRIVQLEIWYHQEIKQWDWRLIISGGEDIEISDKLREIQADQAQLLSLDEAPTDDTPMSTISELLNEISCRFESEATIIHTEDHRKKLFEAIEDARKELVIVSPWLRPDAVDEELIAKLSLSLKRHAKLKVYIGYGIDDNKKNNKNKSHNLKKENDHKIALKRLKDLSSQYKTQVKLVDMGNTHQKLLIVDESMAIITSFNWLSFNPNPKYGLRRETGVILEDRNAIKALRSTLKNVLPLGDV